MLSRHGRKEPSHPISSYDQGDEDGQNQCQEDGDKICSFCQNELFTSELHESLLSSRNRGQQTSTLQYNRSTQDLYSSVRAECRWCQSLTSGILTAIYLDYWNDKWNGSHSDGSSMDEDSMENGEGEAENEIDSSVSTKDSSHTDQYWPISLSDFDQNEGQILVEVNFIREDNVAEYSMIEVSVELLWQTQEKEGGKMLPDLRSDKAVRLSFEVFAKPGCLGSSTGWRH
jgi:hypothetical protein